ncbi:MAG: 3,4-dihydroxy-2-butanone-4-phosphate synthase, partial [Hyphomicrobiales bacterium]|nr:3,4-dihydroxy-2-butanone-4-phosphate synthase [Hyphomicrobiales bacterium]
DQINFMARHGRGLICLSMTGKRTEELGLDLMARKNQDRHSTAFTVSIEAREGVTTGISAADRAKTIADAIDPAKGRSDIVTPGHVFPLVAQEGGVLVRAGHTEAAVDISRMAGLNPAGVICEIMNDDGTMARMPDLVKFAQLHGLKIATIADLIAYRRRTEQLVDHISTSRINSRFGGEFEMRVYANKIGYVEHLVLIYGDIASEKPVMVRMHQANIFADALGDITNAPFFGGPPRLRSGELEASMRLIAREGRGVIVIIRDPNENFLSRALEEREGKAMSEPIHELRQYGVGAQILLHLGLKNIVLLSNSSQRVVGLDGYGITVVGQQPLPADLHSAE